MKRFALFASLCLVGCGTPSLLITPVSRSGELSDVVVQPGRSSAKVAIIPVSGVLANARAPGLITEGENPVDQISQQLDHAANDKAVKAIVLRINSPGGTVTASDTIYQLVRRFSAKTNKPVVASIQEVGASGGYYVACAADRIVATPTGVVGSIGVIFETFSLKGTLDKLGIKSEAIKSATNKDIGSPLRDMTAAERAILQATVDEYFARFKAIVVERRKLGDSTDLATITDGRVFSGEQAERLGLVDRTGLLEDAIDLARQLAKADGARAVLYRRSYESGGSVYARADVPQPKADAPTAFFNLPGALALPAGFYYLWNP